MKFELPKLNYQFTDLEPIIDAKTVEIHYTKHHQTYVNNLNAAVEKLPGFEVGTIEEILKNIPTLPQEIQVVVRNNGGGFHNHNLYWEQFSKSADTLPKGDLGVAVDTAFGNLQTLQETMTKAGLARFGSGWVWLVLNDKKLEVYSTANQDSPLMENKTPLLGIDVWEHAYYLNYQNRRQEYLEKIWDIIDWVIVEKRFIEGLK